MATTAGTTAGKTTVQVHDGEEYKPVYAGPPLRCRRKMKRICCCLTFLLLLNLFLSMYIGHKICRIMHIFGDEDMVLMPGGEESFCNDFCVDLCINGAFPCDLTSCLNGCNSHFGNDDVVADDQRVPLNNDEVPMEYYDDTVVYEYDDVMEEPQDMDQDQDATDYMDTDGMQPEGDVPPPPPKDGGDAPPPPKDGDVPPPPPKDGDGRP